MEAENQNLSHQNRFEMDGVHTTNIVEWNKKRKLQIDQLDSFRPKHKCWVQSLPSEHASVFDEKLESESMYNHLAKGKPNTAVLDDRSSPESAKDSNSFAEFSDTAMSVNEEDKVEADCAKTFLYGYNDKDVTTVENTRSSEEEALTERAYNQLYHDADMQALQNLEEQILGFENCKDRLYSEYAKDGSEQSMNKEFEDVFFSNGVNPNMYVLSSGRWEVKEEAPSSTRAPTIDQEFEQYFSMLML